MTADDGTQPVGPASSDSMGEAMQFRIRAHVSCRDGACGTLARVIVDPVARALTHLVVEPRHHHRGLGRLVPVALVETSGEHVRLRCAIIKFDRLDDAEEMRFLPCQAGELGYRSGDALSWPFYGLAMAMPVGGMGVGGITARPMGVRHAPQPIVSDRVPLGEVEVRRGDKAHASDGEIGAVQGLVIDPLDHHVTHVLLQEGHLWGRKQVAIPISAVTHRAGEIRLELTRQEVRDLPSVNLSSGP